MMGERALGLEGQGRRPAAGFGQSGQWLCGHLLSAGPRATMGAAGSVTALD